MRSRDVSCPSAPRSLPGGQAGQAAHEPGVRRAASPSVLDAARILRREATPSEKALWNLLRRPKMGPWVFRRQHAIGPFIVDFYCSRARLIVEVDGGVHDSQAEADAERQQYLESLGFQVLRFAAEDVAKRMPAVLDTIRAALTAGGPS